MNNVYSVAKKFCEAKNWELTNLELQKMLYISQVFYLGNTGKRLFDADFEAWDYGPVVPNVYRRFKMFGGKPIQEWSFPDDCCRRQIDNTDCEFVHGMAQKLVSLKAFQLVALTHQDGTAWSKAYVPGAKGTPIFESEMKKEYSDFWARND